MIAVITHAFGVVLRFLVRAPGVLSFLLLRDHLRAIRYITAPTYSSVLFVVASVFKKLFLVIG